MNQIVALGAENKTAFSVLTGGGIYQSEAVDDLNNIENFTRYESSLRAYLAENNIAPNCIVCDMHPDYHSSELAKAFAKEHIGSSVIKVQHHFAHIVSCMLDNDINEKVIGVSFDGTGYGSDGKAWGSEFLISDRKSFERKYHLRYMPQPGGDIAAKEPWRMALAYLQAAYGNAFRGMQLGLKDRIGEEKTDIILRMIESGLNSPETSSMGRLFDAASSILDICDISTFEAEAAIKLEAEASQDVDEIYDFEVAEEDINVLPMIREMVEDLSSGANRSVVSAKFHNTVGEIVFNVASRLRSETGISKVLISGGCFQNKYLVNYLDKRFRDSDLELYKHKKYSPTDLGVSIGQAVVAENTYIRS